MKMGMKCLKNETTKLLHLGKKVLVTNCCLANYPRTYVLKEQPFSNIP